MAVATEAGPAPQVEDAAPADPPGADYHGYQGFGFGGYGYGQRPAPYRPNKYKYKGSVVDFSGEYRE